MSDHKTSPLKSPFRLAFRHEGQWVNAYLAATGTMDGAMLLGSVRVSMAERDSFFTAWKNIMSESVADVVQDITGKRPTLRPERAPEHERSGSA